MSRERRAALRRQVWERDRGVCAVCGLDTGRLERVLRRLRDRSRAKDWRYRMTLAALIERINGLGLCEGRMWEADHAIPLVVGGCDTLDNLRTLCTRDHREATSRLARHRSRRRRLKMENFPHNWAP